MRALILLRAHTRIQFLDLLRSPGYVVPTVIFPVSRSTRCGAASHSC
ncbi:MAG: hypothetical protein WB681_00100 [Candidatus Cybelea sp.]